MDRAPDAHASLRSPSATDLGELGLFGGLADETLVHLASTLQVRTLAPRQVAFREGDDARELYIVLAGHLAESKRTLHGRDIPIATLQAGHSFGEICVLDVQRRSTTVTATSHTTLLILTARDLDALYRRDLKGYALFVLNVARNLCRRLQTVNAQLAELAENDAAQRPPPPPAPTLPPSCRG